MTPKEKARELVDKMYLKIPSVYDPTNLPHYPIAKEMSLIAVNEIMEVCPYISKEYCDTVEQIRAYDIQFISYWQKVKQEIELL
jgi:hypothetical protein